MIKLNKLLSEISMFSGDSSTNSVKELFDDFFQDGIIPAKYKELYWAHEDDVKGNTVYHADKDQMEKLKKVQNLNQITPEFIEKMNKYEKVGSTGNFTMILKKRSSEWSFILCDKSAKKITDFFIGIIKVEKGHSSYKISAKKVFKLDAYQVHWSNIADEHKGKGVGRIMYKMVYDYITHNLNGALLSDHILYQGSQKMWRSYIPSIASYFGIELNGVFFPINKDEVNSGTMREPDAMVAMETPPKEVRKIMYNVKGLSFEKGEYGVIDVHQSINEKIFKDVFESPEYTYFANLVDESPTILSLMKKLEDLDIAYPANLTSNTGSVADLKMVVFSFDNALVIVKKSGGKLIMLSA